MSIAAPNGQAALISTMIFSGDAATGECLHLFGVGSLSFYSALAGGRSRLPAFVLSEEKGRLVVIAVKWHSDE